jgi:membrane protease YdiL (CAAX protease family)
LAAFFVASVGLGWLVTLGSAQIASNPLILPLIAIPVSYVPALMAWLVLRVAGTPDERQEWRDRLTRLPGGWRWFVVALLVLPLVHLVGVALATLAGGVFPFHPQLIALVVLFVLTNFGEEIGWRGYALPKLQQRMSPAAAAIVLGLVWALFHWVALAGNDTPLAYITVSTVHLVAISVFMSFIFNRSRESVPAVALAHAIYDTVAIGVAPLIETTVPLIAFALTAVVAWVAVIGLVAVTGPGLGKETTTARGAAARA